MAAAVKAKRKISEPITNERIALRAYELFKQRGAREGDDLNDWLTAERELTQTMRAAMPQRAAKKAAATESMPVSAAPRRRPKAASADDRQRQ